MGKGNVWGKGNPKFGWVSKEGPHQEKVFGCCLGGPCKQPFRAGWLGLLPGRETDVWHALGTAEAVSASD